MKKIIIAAMTVLCISFSPSCDTNTLAEIFVPNISNQWTSNRNSFFFFLPDSTNVRSSTFNGNENRDANQDQFVGNFKDYDIEFTFTSGPDKDVKYKGKFIKGSSPLKISAKGTNGETLEILRQE